jgi:hypothetical protein
MIRSGMIICSMWKDLNASDHNVRFEGVKQTSF